MTRIRVGAAVLVCCAALLPAACGTKSTVKADDAAKQVVKLVSDQNRFSPKDVTCPAGVSAAVGGQFDCHFTGPRSVQYVAHMKIVKVDGERVTCDINVEPMPGQKGS
ncbi:MAG: DUF4333 domain-containing protein [Mycobacterium sp.]|nr:DUF4333 domain-containing protein [Mycobacterium sp.]